MASNGMVALGLSLTLVACATAQGSKPKTREATLAGDILSASAEASGMTSAAVALREAICGSQASPRALCLFRRAERWRSAAAAPLAPETFDATASLLEPTVEQAEPALPAPPRRRAPAARRAPTARPVAFGDLRFGFDSARLGAATRRALEETVDALASEPENRVRIEGHADSVGSEDYNRSLSERRARAIAFYLAAHGVPRARLHPVGLGEAHPVADNRTAQGRARNRRAELTVLQ